jgi:ribosomal-protein-alanine N-acetyltransferase
MFRTSRLILDRISEGDLGAFLELQSDARTREFLGGPVTGALAREKFKTAVIAGPPEYHWAVRNFNNEFLGLVTIAEHHDREDLEISYQFLSKFWGQGFAKEAIEAILVYAKEHLKLPSIIAETQTKNLRSTKLLENLHMQPVRTLERFGAEQTIYQRSL